MIKFSIIIPVYNIEKYIEKCFNSVLNQSYHNYETIIICDKCSDQTEKIVDKFVRNNKKLKKIYTEKTGLAKAKNIGIDNSTGDYLLFLDGDDYLEKDLLAKLNDEIKKHKNLDLIRFQIQTVDKNNNITEYKEKESNVVSGIDAFNKIFKFHFIEPSWAYCYKTSFWKKNNFKFLDNCIAEDYGLTPYIIYKAKNAKIISYIGYNYVQRNNSLMNNTDYEKKKNKMDDVLLQANRLYENIPYNKDTKFFYLFINNSIINLVTSLKYMDYKKIIKKIDKNKLFECYPELNLKQRIKKKIFKFSPYFYKNIWEKLL